MDRETQTHRVGKLYDDGSRLFINGEKLIDAWQERSIATDSVTYYFEAGKEYDLRAEYFNNRDNSVAKLYWKIPTIGTQQRLDMYGEAGKAVRECEQVVAVLGINKTIEREGQDRYDIHLPADQMEFIQEIYKVNPNITVVLVAGSSLAITWMEDKIPAIVNAWYPGEQGGKAVAEVLFGRYNPAGRLPLTYYSSLNEVPAFDDYDVTKGRGYQYFKGKPLYPFGYGLSYTSFVYKNLRLTENNEFVNLVFDLKNAGKMDGDEVSQVYVKLPETGVIMPIKELKGFKRSFIKKGETKRIEIEIKKEQLRYWNEELGKFVVPEGVYEFMVGASSSDIRLSEKYNLMPAK